MADMRQMMVDSIIFQMNHSSSNSRRYFKTLNKNEIPCGISKKDGYIEDVIEFKKYLEELTDEDFLHLFTKLIQFSCKMF